MMHSILLQKAVQVLQMYLLVMDPQISSKEAFRMLTLVDLLLLTLLSMCGQKAKSNRLSSGEYSSHIDLPQNSVWLTRKSWVTLEVRVGCPILLQGNIPLWEALPDPWDELCPQDLDVVHRYEPVPHREPNEGHLEAISCNKAKTHVGGWVFGCHECAIFFGNWPKVKDMIISPASDGVNHPSIFITEHDHLTCYHTLAIVQESLTTLEVLGPHSRGQKRPVQHHQALPSDLLDCPPDCRVWHCQVSCVLPHGLLGLSLSCNLDHLRRVFDQPAPTLLSFESSAIFYHFLDGISCHPGHIHEAGHVADLVVCVEQSSNLNSLVPFWSHFPFNFVYFFCIVSTKVSANSSSLEYFMFLTTNLWKLIKTDCCDSFHTSGIYRLFLVKWDWTLCRFGSPLCLQCFIDTPAVVLLGLL